MLTPDEVSAVPNDSLRSELSHWTVARRWAALEEGLGRGLKYVHEVGAVAAIGMGLASDNNHLFYAVGGASAAAAYIGHKIQSRNEQQRLEADFNQSVIWSELNSRGLT